MAACTGGSRPTDFVSGMFLKKNIMHLVDDFQQMKNMFVEKYVLLGLFCFVFPLCIWKDLKTFGIRLCFNQSCYY